MQKGRSIPINTLRLRVPDGTARRCAWRMEMVRPWLAASTALVAAVAFSLSVTEAGARDRNEGHTAPHVRSGPGPSARHFESAPRVRSGGQPQVYFRSSGAQGSGGQAHFNNSYRGQPQVHFN